MIYFFKIVYVPRPMIQTVLAQLVKYVPENILKLVIVSR
jgi:hypothetical protein